MITKQLTQLYCKEHQEFGFLTRRYNMKARLYSDFENAITAAFSEHPTPILLPPSAIRELTKNNAYLLNKRFIKRISISSTSTDICNLCYQFVTEKLICNGIAAHTSAKLDTVLLYQVKRNR